MLPQQGSFLLTIEVLFAKTKEKQWYEELFPLIPLFYYVESFLLLALVAEETLHVVEVLNTGQHSAW